MHVQTVRPWHIWHTCPSTRRFGRALEASAVAVAAFSQSVRRAGSRQDARAVVNKPSILLADEPTGNLDPQLSSEIMVLFEQFNQVGVSVLIATHDLELIASMPNRMLTLTGGQLVRGNVL